MSDLSTVAMHQLKAGLARCVEAARAGEPVLITSHGTPVARLVGIPAVDSPGLQGLLAAGAASWSGGKPQPQPAPPPALSAGGRSLAALVIDDRG